MQELQTATAMLRARSAGAEHFIIAVKYSE